MSRNVPPSSFNKCAAWAMEKQRGRPSTTDPIEIPAPAVYGGARAVLVEREARSHWEDEEEGRCGDDDGEVVPPHVLLARRRAAFSMCSGQGRTLKGRDLRRVRDSVLRMTGFIES